MLVQINAHWDCIDKAMEAIEEKFGDDTEVRLTFNSAPALCFCKPSREVLESSLAGFHKLSLALQDVYPEIMNQWDGEKFIKSEHLEKGGGYIKELYASNEPILFSNPDNQ